MQIQQLRTQKKRYYAIIDEWANENANRLKKNNNPTKAILKQIRAIYFGAKTEREFINIKGDTSTKFNVAYHTAVTGDVEFLIARTLYHFSDKNKLDWNIYLRKQTRKMVPDIRIDKNGKTHSIIEIKTKVGWMQYFFSGDVLEKGIERFHKGESKNDPRIAIVKQREQLWKYIQNFNISKSNFFVLIPSLKQAHRKSLNRTYDYYKYNFSDNSNLGKRNLVVLTNDLNYEVSESTEPENVTDEFLTMINCICN